MDSKAVDEKMSTRLRSEPGIKSLTVPLSTMDKIKARKQIITWQTRLEYRQLYKQLSISDEPIQKLVKQLFELQSRWMGSDNR